MKITPLNLKYNNFLTKKIPTFKSNPIKNDSFEYTGNQNQDNDSYIKSLQTKLNTVIGEIQALEEMNTELNSKINTLSDIKDKIKLSYEDGVILIRYANVENPKALDFAYKKIEEIIKNATKNENITNEILQDLADIARTSFRYSESAYNATSTMQEGVEIKIKRLTYKIHLNMGKIKDRQIKQDYYQALIDDYQKRKYVKSDDEYRNISELAKSYIISAYGEEKGQELIKQLANSKVLTLRGAQEWCGVDELKLIAPDAQYIELENNPTLIAIPLDNKMAIDIIRDIEYGMVAPLGRMPIILSRKEDKSIPYTFKKYTNSDKPQLIDYTYVDLTNPRNRKILDVKKRKERFIRCLTCMPFTYNEFGVVDMNNEENQRLFDNTQYLYPVPSHYYYGSLGDRAKNVTKNIPIEHLEKLGFSNVDILSELIKNGKLDGKINADGTGYVTINSANRLGKNKNLDILELLRKQNPRIKTFKEVIKALQIKPERLDYAILTGEFEIINEYLNAADREQRYIDVTTPKNQEFIRKIKFEQELKKQLLEEQRKQNEAARIERQDQKQRLQGLRMSLVWEFMPNTKLIATQLAKQDGYLCKLLAKEDDPDETLTQKEQIKINSYRKEMWLQAGTEELNEAHKKVSAILKQYKQHGISAISEEFIPIFEKYGLN